MSMTEPKWLNWVKALQAISQTGNHFAENPYDLERYSQIGTIAAEILEAHSDLSSDEILAFTAREFGYATPKVDVRGVVFREDRILLVREIADGGRWALPGGWADVNETPSEGVVREIFEESGFETEVVRLLAVYDRTRQGHLPPFPYHVYKLFFLCDITGGSPTTNLEASEIAFFDRDALPELSVSRVTETQIHRFFEHRENPGMPTDFD
jgi:ADP-ribose pyrophosphatase YjhB (NUDIX family)